MMDRREYVSRREYAEVAARSVYHHDEQTETRDVFARILDRELSRRYTKDGKLRRDTQRHS